MSRKTKLRALRDVEHSRSAPVTGQMIEPPLDHVLYTIPERRNTLLFAPNPIEPKDSDSALENDQKDAGESRKATERKRNQQKGDKWKGKDVSGKGKQQKVTGLSKKADHQRGPGTSKRRRKGNTVKVWYCVPESLDTCNS